MKLSSYSFIFLLIISFILVLPLLSADTNQSTCGNLNIANEIYNQNSTITPSGIAPCINITAQNITFNGNGFYITNITFNYTAILSNQFNTTLSGVNINLRNTTGSIGIRLLNSTFSTVYNNTLNNSRIDLTSSYNNILDSNNIKTPRFGNLDYGISLSLSRHNIITNNNISTFGVQGNYGIFFSLSTNNTASNNVISTTGTSTQQYGIYLFTSTNNTLITNNISTNGLNANRGIYLSTSSNGNNITNNNILTNGIGAGNSGIYIFSNSNANSITNNTIRARGTINDYGIVIDSSLSNIMIANNILTTVAGDYGIFI